MGILLVDDSTAEVRNRPKWFRRLLAGDIGGSIFTRKGDLGIF
jgi:hypothetical protein